jgi:hypothetical protein
VEEALTVPLQEDWTGEDVTVAQIERELARLRFASDEGGGRPNLRTSVMTHCAWVPPEWLDAAESTLAGMNERHPSRTLILVPKPDEPDGLDAVVSIRCFPFGESQVCSEVIELVLRGNRAFAPASLVLPLLISDLPVFCRWRGEPEWDGIEFPQLVDIADRLIVDSTEWDDLPRAYVRLASFFERTAVSDIAWARTQRWRALLASLWPDIGQVQSIRVHGTRAQGYLLAGWLRSRLGEDIAVEIDERNRLDGIDLDGEPTPFPPGDPPHPSDVLSEELDRISRDRIYEQAVSAAAG